MDFEKTVPEWQAEGTEPPASLKESGFEAGYKPPAAYFNWFWNRVSACLKEIREKLSGHATNKENPHSVTAAQLGLDKVNNTPDAEKSVAFASEAGVGRKVANKFTMRINGGSTENTDLFTYDGSGGKSVNLTPEKLGSAEKDLSNVDGEVFRNKASESGVVGIPIVEAASTDGVAYTATVEGVTELYNGLIITIIPKVVSASTAITLNVNGLGAKMVRLPLSFNNAAMNAPKLETYFTAGRPITLQYDAAYLANDGIWKTLGKQKTSAQDLYGTVPVEGGGTGAGITRDALLNLGFREAPYLGSGDYADITDLNKLTLCGLFQVAGSFANAPLTNPCFVFSICGTNGRFTQFCWRSNSTSATKDIYMRRTIDETTWDDWTIVAGPGLISASFEVCQTTPTTVTNGKWYLVKQEV